MSRKRVFISILTLCVVLWSFAPTGSFIYQANASGSILMEICTADGFITIELDEAGNPISSSRTEKPSCPFCAIVSSKSTSALYAPFITKTLLVNNKEKHILPKTFILTSSFKRGLNTPSRAPPVLS